MGITPIDIHNKEFPKKLFGGIDPDAVDEFLDQVIREFESLIKENERLKEAATHISEKLEQYRSLEDTINKTLVVAQEAAEDLKESAKREADLVIQDARLQAQRMLEAGQSKARKIMEENSDLTRAAYALRTQIRSLLKAQLEAIDTIPDPFAEAAAGSLPAEPGK